MVLSTNKDKLLKQMLLGKITPPTMAVDGGFIGGYVVTWEGKPKIGIGIGGIKYNVKVGDPCLGWPEAEHLEPGAALVGADHEPGGSMRPEGTVMAFQKMSCVGNKVTAVSGDGKGAEGVVTGKARAASAGYHVLAHFPSGDLEKLNIGDKVRVDAEGVGMEIDGFDGRIFNMSPSFLESIGMELEGDTLTIPVVKEIPAYGMGYGVGGGPPESDSWCIQTSPPHLVEALGLGDLKIGDLVACKDILMSYGKGYYKGAATVGIVTVGGSDIAGHGPGVMAIAASKRGKIVPRINSEVNIATFLGLEA